ncbi:MAG: hypothetical protein D3925_01910, partial [Candidatus Electrothrix sp. AR5]|nr:hypothetical protein [Candidatus Electrothrix sp. AR5]
TEEPVVSHLNSLIADVAIKEDLSEGLFVMEAPAHKAEDHRASTKHHKGKKRGIKQLPTELGITDGRILVRLKDTDFVALEPDSITQFNLTTAPENLRLGLRLPAFDDEVYFLPLTFETGQQVSCDIEFKKQINTLLRRLYDKLTGQVPESTSTPRLPDPLELQIIIESDAPCQFTLSQFVLHYRLARNSLPNGKLKEILRFTNDQLDQQQISFDIPAPITLTHASLRLAGDGFSTESDETSAASSGQRSSLLELPEKCGLRLDSTHYWSSPIDLTEPILCHGLDLLLSALSPNTQLQLEIVADNNGPSSGDRLATAQANLVSPHHPQLLRFSFETSLLLQHGIYWLILECQEGAAVWRLQSKTNAHTLSWGENSGKGNPITEMVGVAAWITSKDSAATTQGLPEITLSGQPLPLTQEGNDWVYDLKHALGTTITGYSLLSNQLTILTSGPKTLTLYPPCIEYELGEA